jgi:hypothetical protein
MLVLSIAVEAIKTPSVSFHSLRVAEARMRSACAVIVRAVAWSPCLVAIAATSRLAFQYKIEE